MPKTFYLEMYDEETETKAEVVKISESIGNAYFAPLTDSGTLLPSLLGYGLHSFLGVFRNLVNFINAFPSISMIYS